ncbi:glutamate 5-kinase [Rhodanobacter glycinis]|jgi:glutamate 5-kinase|uniref:Glutamate 5-kinase n=1 Tax=Rhodanobacter glycinis TaxID=582702 RepID=A0A1I4C931_9GAMM|nr:glutamate 5-kinase [Rhodanobacter glycinis]SFK76571.1 glutamate 5-kinase [Rhodanobacter glycinis]
MSMQSTLPEQPLPPWRRAVLKVGSNLLAADGGGLTPRFAEALASFMASSHAGGRQVVLVSSGAVAAGRALLHARASAGRDLAARQAMASLGQAPMIGLWQSLSARPVAQVLLTHDDLRNRRRYLNARATLLGLLALDAVPVVNENDTVAVDELKLGDNDNLAAIVAALVDADLLLIASDVDALYTADPRRDPAATPIAQADAVTPALMAMAGGSGSIVGTGGMRTKLEAAEKAGAAGIPTALFDGRNTATVQALAQGQLRGTLIHAPHTRMQARKYWLLHAPASSGRIRIDAGAARALSHGHASLLPGGILAAEGEFQRGDLVEIIDASERRIARGLSQYAAVEVRRLAGRHSREIETLLGYSHGTEVVHRDDLANMPDRLEPAA